MTMSTRDQIIVCVAAGLMLLLVLTFASYMAGQQTRQNAQALATEGVAVEGKITNKVERFGGVVNGPKYTWWLDLTYTTEDGVTLTKTIGVDESAYQKTPVGPIPVTYIRSDPSVFFITGIYDSVNHSEADSEVVGGMTLYGGIASVVLGIVLAALLLTRGGGAPQHQVKSPSVQQTRAVGRKQPGQFGRRA
jgi:hypothetical protein